MKAWIIAGAALALAVSPCAAETLQTYKLVLKGHKFEPAELRVPVGKPFYVEVTNQEPVGRLRVRPLSAGRFKFFDDFHPVATGFIVAE